MEKQKITIPQKKWISFDFGNLTDIQVKPYLSLEDNLKLVETYLLSVFEENNGKYDYAVNEIQAEYSMIVATVDLCTNLSIDFTSETTGIDGLINSGLWDEIRNRIVNYEEFKIGLYRILSHVREDIAIERSVGASFDKVSTAIIDLVQKIASADISESGLQKMIDDMRVETSSLMEKIKPQSEKVVRKKKEVPQ